MTRTPGTAPMLVLLLLLPLLVPSVSGAQDQQPLWRSTGLDPSLWTDRPESEDSPMMESYTGNAVISMSVSYQESHFSGRVEGVVVIELFEQWAPITTGNMIAHVESGLYNGVFFHRVIDDFVTQSGDPTCKALGAYPVTSPSCGSGGTGETIPLELDGNLSHVDGAIGMARSADPDSADAQWYIAETEAHNLDPENRDDEGYATFGIVRDGMSHIRAIAVTPTSDDPTGIEEIQNPASSAGRPIYQVEILSMEMIGVADPYGLIRNPPEPVDSQSSVVSSVVRVITFPLLSILIVAAVVGVFRARTDKPVLIAQDDGILVAELVIDGQMTE
ncbi:MAG: peptidylprolyl isomerase [Candidatus Poseidonia sp.]|nr:peptidylprolyl isomerase [Poseidonia sp.]